MTVFILEHRYAAGVGDWLVYTYSDSVGPQCTNNLHSSIKPENCSTGTEVVATVLKILLPSTSL